MTAEDKITESQILVEHSLYEGVFDKMDLDIARYVISEIDSEVWLNIITKTAVPIRNGVSNLVIRSLTEGSDYV